MTSRIFLFGKLPAADDFVRRGLLPGQEAAWDRRCTAAIEDAGRRFGDELDAALELTQPWSVLLPPSEPEPFWQIACVAPSCDRAGRAFLFVVGAADREAWTDRGQAMAGHLMACLRLAITRSWMPDHVMHHARVVGCDELGSKEQVVTGWSTGRIGAAAPADGGDTRH